jgi:hypothetical protein
MRFVRIRVEELLFSRTAHLRHDFRIEESGAFRAEGVGKISGGF